MKRLPVRWIFAWMYNGLLPNDRLMKTIGVVFGLKVIAAYRGRLSFRERLATIRQFKCAVGTFISPLGECPSD